MCAQAIVGLTPPRDESDEGSGETTISWWGLVASFVWRAGRALVNMSYLVYNAYSVGPASFVAYGPGWEKGNDHESWRNSWDHWQFERSLVALLEGLGAIVISVSCLQSFYKSMRLQPQDRQMWPWVFKTWLDSAASFSGLSLLPKVTPGALFENKERGVAFFVVMLIHSVLITLPLAAMAVAVKIASLNFITETSNWTVMNWITFVLFCNALAGLRGDMEMEKLKATCDGDHGRLLRNMCHISNTILKNEGNLAGLVIFTAAPASAINKLGVRLGG